MKYETERDIKVTMEFSIPEHKKDLEDFLHAYEYLAALGEIYEKCRYIINSSEGAEVVLAETIKSIILEAAREEDLI